MVTPEQRKVIELYAKENLGFKKVVFDSEYYDKNQGGHPLLTVQRAIRG